MKYLINPESNFMFFWSLIHIGAIIYYLTIMPYLIAFQETLLIFDIIE